MADGALPNRLSAKFTDSFAYATVKDRLPVILTKVVDTVYQYRAQAVQKHGEAATEDCKSIVSHLSKLKNEMQTDKVLLPFQDPEKEDADIWRKYLEEEVARNAGELPKWFQSAWLYVECHMYRKIMEAIHLSTELQSFDPFGEQKRTALLQSLDAVTLLGNHLDKQINYPTQDTQQSFDQFIQISLWGNKCDLSISAGVENSQNIDPIAPLQTLQSNILVNDLDKLWPVLTQARAKNPAAKVRLDIVLDNAGFELFTDLCLAEFALKKSAVDVVHMHYKAMPWFVSDVTYQDFMWTIDTLQNHKSNILSSLGKSWHRRLSERSWVISSDKFWTTPHDFSEMKQTSPDLYNELSQSDLILLKGDLNYRKLVGDRSWEHTIPYVEALCGFHPAPHCALRTCKADVVVGLPQGLSEELTSNDKDWMTKGEYAVIQYCGMRDQS